jgi:hypothetical protein
MHKVKLATGTNRNQCSGCGELFNSIAAFDKHRHGRFGIPNKEHEGEYLDAVRKCYSTDEMTAKGMIKTNDGFWASKAFDYHGMIGRQANSITDAE